MIPLCREEGLGIIPWSPLARGLLTGTRTREDPRSTARAETDTYAHRMYTDAADWDVVEETVEVAEGRGVSPAKVALAWLLGRPGVTAPIVGTTKVEHLEEAVAALEVELTDDEVRRLEEPYQPHPVLGHG